MEEYFDDVDFKIVHIKALIRAVRRERICKYAIPCPNCKTLQVQLIDANLPALWKCRHCKHQFIHEPLILEQKNN